MRSSGGSNGVQGGGRRHQVREEDQDAGWGQGTAEISGFCRCVCVRVCACVSVCVFACARTLTDGSIPHQHCHSHTLGFFFCGWLWLLFKQGRQLPQTSRPRRGANLARSLNVRAHTNTSEGANVSLFAVTLYGTLLSFCSASRSPLIRRRPLWLPSALP